MGTYLSYMPMFAAGLLGMPRRVVDYAPEFEIYNSLATIGAIVLGLSTLPFLYTAIVSLFRGEKAGKNPWRSLTLEWFTSSPPPPENFEELPVVEHGPYDYGEAAGILDEQMGATAAAD